MKPPAPLRRTWADRADIWRATPWEVRTAVVGDRIVVYAGRGLATHSQSQVIVSPPNFLERHLGITLDRKLERAVRRVQGYVDSLEEVRLKGIELREYLRSREVEKEGGPA